MMICAFLCNGVIFGIHNSGGSLFVSNSVIDNIDGGLYVDREIKTKS